MFVGAVGSLSTGRFLMLRLRTTTGLSLLALVIGIAGTAELSTWTSGWQGPPPRVAVARITQPHHGASIRRGAVAAARHQTVSVGPPRIKASPINRGFVASVRATAPPVAPPPELVPLSMPADNSLPWDELRGHLDGRVVLHVQVDGNGRVAAAGIVESSGDAVLDEHALRGVRGWRFAVPADQPDGISGNLPMRFSSHGDAIARVP
ncbi:MAG: energy transducer TonB [Rhodanobacter sp.]